MKNQDINKIWEAYDEYCLKEKFLICLDILKKIHQVFASYGFIGNLQAFSVLFLFEFHVEFSDESVSLILVNLSFAKFCLLVKFCLCGRRHRLSSLVGFLFYFYCFHLFVKIKRLNSILKKIN